MKPETATLQPSIFSGYFRFATRLRCCAKNYPGQDEISPGSLRNGGPDSPPISTAAYSQVTDSLEPPSCRPR